jgi:predicted ATPase with chaperone activity
MQVRVSKSRAAALGKLGQLGPVRVCGRPVPVGQPHRAPEHWTSSNNSMETRGVRVLPAEVSVSHAGVHFGVAA